MLKVLLKSTALVLVLHAMSPLLQAMETDENEKKVLKRMPSAKEEGEEEEGNELSLLKALNAEFKMDEKTGLPKGWNLVSGRGANKPLSLNKIRAGVQLLGDNYTFSTNVPDLKNFDNTIFTFSANVRSTNPGVFIQYYDGKNAVSSKPYASKKGEWEILNIEFKVDGNAKFHRLYSAILGAVKGNPNPSVDIRDIKLQQKQITEQKADIELKVAEPEKKAPNLLNMDEKTALPKGWNLVSGRGANNPPSLKKKGEEVKLLGDNYTFSTNVPDLKNFDNTIFTFSANVRSTNPGVFIQYYDGKNAVSSKPYASKKGEWETLNIEFKVDGNAKFHRLYSAIMGAVRGNPNPSVDIKNIKLYPKLLDGSNLKIEELKQIEKEQNPPIDKKTQKLFNNIKNLNPNMEDFIALAWAKFRLPDLGAAMGEDLDNEALAYTFRRPDNQNITLYRNIMPGYQLNCGYYSLGISSDQAREQLLENLKPANPKAQLYKNMIAQELVEAVNGNLLPNQLKANPDIIRLKQTKIDAQADVDAWVRSLNTLLGRGENAAYTAEQLTLDLFPDIMAQEEITGLTVFELFSLLTEARSTVEATTTAIHNWCTQDEVIQTYINAEIKPGKELTFLTNTQGEQKVGVIDALADMMGVDLNIYEPQRNNPQQLKLTHTYKTPGAARTIDMLYTPGHFDRLGAELHRHIAPPMKFQNPFDNYEGQEASDGAIVLLADAMKEADKTLFPEEKRLTQELDNLTGYDDENKEAFIVGYQLEEQLHGRLRSRNEAEQEYNKRKTDLESQLQTGDKARKLKKTPQYLLKNYIKAFDKADRESKITLAQLGDAAKNLGLDIFPSIKYPKGFKVYHQGKVNDTIFKAWDAGYNFFEIKQDGLYGGKVENKLEKLLIFNERKGERIVKEDSAGIQKFYTQDPQPEDVHIYEEMIASFPNSYIGKLASHGKRLFNDRKYFLEQAEKGIYQPKDYGGAMIHTDYSNPKEGAYDNVSLQHRLNNIHHSITQPFLTAKARGNAHLQHFRDYMEDYRNHSYCFDGSSRSLQDYVRLQEEGRDTKTPPLMGMSKQQIRDKVITDTALKYTDNPNGFSSAQLREGFQKYENQACKDGIFLPKDVEDAVEYARMSGVLED